MAKTITVTVVFMTTTITIASMAVTATFIVVRVTWTVAFAVAAFLKLAVVVTHAVGKSQAEMSLEMPLTASEIPVTSMVAAAAIIGQIVGKIVRPVVVREDFGDDCLKTGYVVVGGKSITRTNGACLVDR